MQEAKQHSAGSFPHTDVGIAGRERAVDKKARKIKAEVGISTRRRRNARYAYGMRDRGEGEGLE